MVSHHLLTKHAFEIMIGTCWKGFYNFLQISTGPHNSTYIIWPWDTLRWQTITIYAPLIHKLWTVRWVWTPRCHRMSLLAIADSVSSLSDPGEAAPVDRKPQVDAMHFVFPPFPLEVAAHICMILHDFACSGISMFFECSGWWPRPASRSKALRAAAGWGRWCIGFFNCRRI